MKKIGAFIFVSGLLAAAALAQTRPDPGTAVAGGSTITRHAIENYVPVTDAALRKPDPNDWLMLRGNYEGWGYSTLSQVTPANVKGLQLAWARTMEPGINQSTPLIYKGVMFLGNSNDVIQAINAVTGELLWQYRRSLPPLDQLHNNPWGQRKRGIAIYNDKVYFVSRDNFIVALDARNGKPVWETDRGGDHYVTNSTGPIVVHGVVIAGSVCQEAPFTCYVTGNDAETGKELWRNGVIPKKGEPGDETWGGMPDDQRWLTGVWGPITYDPELDLAYYGSSGVGPASEGQRKQIGATLAGTDTRYAIDPRTGKVAWKHQVLPRDNWDQDCTFEMVPITTAVNPDPKADGMMAVGKGAKSASRRTLTGIPCKTGIMWSFDAAKGNFLWAKSTVHQTLVDKIDPKGLVTVNEAATMQDINKTYRICPGYAGGRDWPFSAYSPQTNVMYIQLQNLCSDVTTRADNIPSTPRDEYNTREPRFLAEGKTKLGRIDAISVETGKTLWSWENDTAVYSPILATASGLLFNGGADRYLRAFDQSTGHVLWQTRLGSQVQAAPVTFSVKGKQYVAVTAGGGFNYQSGTLFPNIDQPSGGNMVYVFALPD